MRADSKHSPCAAHCDSACGRSRLSLVCATANRAGGDGTHTEPQAPLSAGASPRNGSSGSTINDARIAQSAPTYRTYAAGRDGGRGGGKGARTSAIGAAVSGVWASCWLDTDLGSMHTVEVNPTPLPRPSFFNPFRAASSTPRSRSSISVLFSPALSLSPRSPSPLFLARSISFSLSSFPRLSSPVFAFPATALSSRRERVYVFLFVLAGRSSPRRSSTNPAE